MCLNCPAPDRNLGWRQEAESRLIEAGFKHIHSEWLSKRDWWGVMSFAAIDSNYWELFDILQTLMTDREYAETVRHLWTATNGLSPSDAQRRLIEHGRAITRDMWMAPDDVERFQELPDIVRVYRGCDRGMETGWSWALDLETAEHFAASYDVQEEHDRIVVTGEASKSDIIALFTGDNWDENEVIVPGHLVRFVTIEPWN